MRIDANQKMVGLMDHWVPSHDKVSRFWKTPFSELKPQLDVLLDSLPVNNFTFYSKWYSNGIKSSLPFLPNHPEAMNVKTDNQWGRDLINYFHERGISVGLMLQCYTFESGMLPEKAVLGEWSNREKLTGLSVGGEIVNPLWEGFDELLTQMLEEHLREFPETDALFLEFEGLMGVREDTVLKTMGTGKPVPEVIRQLWNEFAYNPGPEVELWRWTERVQRNLASTMSQHLNAVEKVFDCMDYQGIKGVVYKEMSYETPYIDKCLPSKNWWLLPWYYWGWGSKNPVDRKIIQNQINFCLNRFRELIKNEFKLCYIGNATLPTANPDTIAQMLEFCLNNNMAGYLGMGNFLPDIGLQWHGATPQTIEKAMSIYQKVLEG